MSELIDRQALKNKLKRWDECDPYEFVEIAFHAIEDAPAIAASTWHRVEEPPKETGKYAVCWTYQEKIYWDWLIFFDGNWELRAGLPLPDYWMPIEPPKEDA